MRLNAPFTALFVIIALIAAPNCFFAAGLSRAAKSGDSSPNAQPSSPSTSVTVSTSTVAPRKSPSASPAPAFPGTNGRIAFTRGGGADDGNNEIYSMNPDGSGLRQLTNNEAYDDQPRYSADGTKIVFMSNRDGNFEVYSMNANGTNQTRLTNNFAADGFPGWSPDGAKIVFVRGDLRNPSTFEIWTMNANGSNQTQLTTNSEIEGVPVWSPDGTKIAFMSSAASIFSPNNFEIYVMDANGGNRTRLTNDSLADAQPAWSPDGTRLVFASGDATNPNDIEIFVMNANGTNRTRITTNTVTDGFPVWSPDGTRIAFVSGSLSDEGGVELFVMDANGNNRTQLTNNFDLDWFPDWGVAPAAAPANPIDESEFFVRRHYSDFLNRTGDLDGVAFWVNNIEGCGADAQCREVKRIDTSAAFFLSIEFQQTGYLVHRFYKAAFGNIPAKPVPLTFAEFLPDTQSIGQGVIIGFPGAEQRLEANKQSFASDFVNRPRFTAAYPQSMTAAQFVDTLNANTGNSLTQAERNDLVTRLGNGQLSRAQVVRAVAENAEFSRREFNVAFVLIQYFGYLRRDPDAAPDGNFNGYNFWLGKLNQFNGDFRAAEMVKAFITSGEYRQRFAF